MKLAKQEENENMAEVIKEKLNWFKIDEDMERIALAIEGENSPSFQQVTEYAKAICEGMKEPIARAPTNYHYLARHGKSARTKYFRAFTSRLSTDLFG